MQSLIIGVVGATGAAGQTALDIIAHQEFPSFKVKRVKAYASKSSAGKKLNLGEDTVVCEELSVDSIKECDALIFATESNISKEWIPKAAELGIVCIDKSSAYRQDPKTTLLVPEVNSDSINKDEFKKWPIIASPNCCSTPITVSLKPLIEKYGVERVVVSTYQSVSGSGQAGIEVLTKEAQRFFELEDLKQAPQSSTYPKAIAFNAMPFVGSIDDDGHTDEEEKIVAEIRKILGRPDFPVSATSVRIPVFVGHSFAVTVELSKEANREDLEEAMKTGEGIVYPHETETDRNAFTTPRECHGKSEVFVSRVRRAESFKNGWSYWACSDNLRKGAALNALQILDKCVSLGLVSK